MALRTVLKRILLFFCFCVMIFLIYRLFFIKTSQNETTTSTALKTSQTSQTSSGLPNVKTTDWELVLVNRDHPKAEMSPDLTQIGSIYVDSRIAENVQAFLTAAQKIDSREHLISGYRSVSYQEGLFEQYVQTEMANDPSLSRTEAEDIVKTYSQPAGASEHQTGLAIDMSTVDALNESDPETVEKVQAIAPEYGFVLRFQKDKKSSTGIGYEDWHYRYVGKFSANYMVKHHLSLEEYLDVLKENE